MAVDNNNPKILLDGVFHGFKVKSITGLPSLNNIIYQLEHEKTGAKLIHLSNDDDNNCFSVAFRTTPTDSTGVAHILEHTALCGSKQYPVRDPFFSMIKRSMNTFMNAFTASDWTMYPFATQNRSDYFNLLKIYLDAAFFPALTELNFKQEGHRLDFEEEGNINSPLTIKGVVYNEMKGAMASPGRVLDQKMAEELFPTVTYKYNSGGDPLKITDLTHQQLIDFHKSHYHPSNALFFTYGNFSLLDSLETIEDMVLSKFDKIDIDTFVPCEKRYTVPKSKTDVYPLSEAEDDGKSCQVALGWLTCDVTNAKEVLSLQILNQILLGHAGAPLRKALLESRLGKSLTDSSGLDDDYREPVFSIGLQGVAEDDLDKVEPLVIQVLTDITQKGIQMDQIDSAIHQIELDTREISGGHYPYSLNLLFRFFTAWAHGGDPVQSLDFDSAMESVKELCHQPGYFEGLIEKYILRNSHCAKVSILPDYGIAKREADALTQKLQAIKQTLSEKELNSINFQAKQLKELQEEEEDLSCLPTLSVSDIPEKIKYIEPVKRNSRLNTEFYDCPTNGISYYHWYFKISKNNDELREWLPLLSYLLPASGAGEHNYESVSKKVSRYTGGFGASVGAESSLNKPGKLSEYLSLSSKALDENINALFDLADLIINQWHLDDIERIKVLINQRTNHMINSVVQAGHSYAVSLANRGLTPLLGIDEIYGGIHQVRFMKKVSEMDSKALFEKLQSLKSLLKQMINVENCSMVVIGNQKNFSKIEQNISAFYEKLNSASEEKNIPVPTKDFKPQLYKEACLATTPVSYVAQSYKVADYSHEDSPILLVLSTLLKSCFLHGELREKGGAYGGLSSYDVDNGVLSFLSYRDPHLSRTIKVYEDVLKWLKSGVFTDEDVEQAILQTCSRIDTPLSPAGKALSEHLLDRKGKTKELRQAFRSRILSCTRKDLIEAGSKWLEQSSSIAAVTSGEMVENEKDQLDELKIQRYNLF